MLSLIQLLLNLVSMLFFGVVAVRVLAKDGTLKVIREGLRLHAFAVCLSIGSAYSWSVLVQLEELLARDMPIAVSIWLGIQVVDAMCVMFICVAGLALWKQGWAVRGPAGSAPPGAHSTPRSLFIFGLVGILLSALLIFDAVRPTGTAVYVNSLVFREQVFQTLSLPLYALNEELTFRVGVPTLLIWRFRGSQHRGSLWAFFAAIPFWLVTHLDRGFQDPLLWVSYGAQGVILAAITWYSSRIWPALVIHLGMNYWVVWSNSTVPIV